MHLVNGVTPTICITTNIYLAPYFFPLETSTEHLISSWFWFSLIAAVMCALAHASAQMNDLLIFFRAAPQQQQQQRQHQQHQQQQYVMRVTVELVLQ